MKKHFPFSHRPFRLVLSVVLALLLLQASGQAAQLKEAKVSQVIKEVNLLPGQANPRPAAVNDPIDENTAVRTGGESRAELTFSDLTITRLGENTVFSFDKGTRNVNLGGGALLLHVPKNSGGAKIRTAAVTAAITGTTVLMEYHKDVYKFIVIEGTACVCPSDLKQEEENGLAMAQVQKKELQAGEESPCDEAQFSEEDNVATGGACREVLAGQMLMGRPGEPLTDPLDVDISAILETSALITDFPPLDSQNEMEQTADDQKGGQSNGTFIAVAGLGLGDPTNINEQDQANNQESPTPSPSATASPTATVSPTSPPPALKFGTPPVITSPDPYVIDPSTLIVTDPTITTNGITDEGRIYRDNDEDGPFTVWAFGDTSEFDETSGFEGGPDTGTFLQDITVFKFANLILAGDPMIDTEGGPVNLGLVAVGDLMTEVVALPGAGLQPVAMTFAGIETLLLATVDGTITLGPGYEFMGTDRMFIYARGSETSLVIDSNISTNNDLRLYSEGPVTLGGDMSTTNFSSFSAGDFSHTGLIEAVGFYVTSLGNITINGGEVPDVPGGGGAIYMNATGALTIFVQGGGENEANTRDSFEAYGETISLFVDEPTDLAFEAESPIFSAGLGGIQASNVNFGAADLQLLSLGDININGTFLTPNATFLGGLIDAGGSLNSGGDVTILEIFTGLDVDVQGSVFASTVQAGGLVNVTDRLSAGFVSAGGDITAGTVSVFEIDATSGILTATSGGIVPYVFSYVEPEMGPPTDGANAEHVFDVLTVVSPAGIDFSGNQFNGISGLSSGGKLTLNVDYINFDSTIGVGAVHFEGADAGAFDNDPETPAGGGDGGTFIVNAAGEIYVGELISATTGRNEQVFTGTGAAGKGPFVSGNGGTVFLNSAAGPITVDSTIIVSSNDDALVDEVLGPDPAFGFDPPRNSASGGEIGLYSQLETGPAITLNEGGSLLSLLDYFAPGPGGTISLISEGGDILVLGEIRADRGTITISSKGMQAPLVGPRGGLEAVSLVTVDVGSLTAETLSILSSGNIDFGLDDGVHVNAVTLTLSAESDLNIGGLDTSETAYDSSGNVTIEAGQDITTSGALLVMRSNGSQTTGLNISLTAGNVLSLSHNLDLQVYGDGLETGGNIDVAADGGITATRFIYLATEADDNVGTGLNIDVDSGGAFTTGGLQAFTTLYSGEMTEGANITVNVDGDMVATGFDTGDGIIFGSIALGTEIGGDLATGANITLDVTGTLQTLRNFDAEVSIDGAIGTGGNIDIKVDGPIIVGEVAFPFVRGLDRKGGPLPISNGNLSLVVEVDDADITDGGNILLEGGSDLTAGTFLAEVVNSGFIEDGGGIKIDVEGTISVTDATWRIQTPPGLGNFELAALTALGPTLEVEAGALFAFDRVDAYIYTSFGFADHGEVSLTIAGPIQAGTLNVRGKVMAQGDVFASTLSSTDVQSDSSIAVGVGGIVPFQVELLQETGLHLLSAPVVSSLGGIDFDGQDADGDFAAATHGGKLQIDADALTVSFVGDIQSSVSANGGNGSLFFTAGNGGLLEFNTAGVLSVESDIEATSGYIDGQITDEAQGEGGTVNLNSSQDTVTVAARVEVSSNDPEPDSSATPAPPHRRSSKGGNISVKSGKTSGVAVNIANTGQLLALLDSATAGPGGKIEIHATTETGNSSQINVNGRVQADQGTVDIRHQGDNGVINLTNADVRAETVKVAALGTNGALNIGGGQLSADTTLKLYSPSSNGTINFVANVSLSSPQSIIAANTVNINNGVVVHINSANPADVFTTNANYTNFGGNGSLTGTFSGAGANNPQPLADRPPLDAAPPPGG